MQDNTIILNWDGDAEGFFLQNLQDWSDVEDAAKAYLDTYYKDTGIGDILFNILDQVSITPSKVFTTKDERCLAGEQDGHPITLDERVKMITACHAETGVLATDVWIEHCKEIGIRPWISLRMNDCHCPDDEYHWLHPSFFYEARRNGWTVGEEYGYFRHCFNYAYPQVRQKFLDYLEEQLSHYDVYGVELDFLREPVCFDYRNQRDTHLIMNRFMEEAKRIVTRCEAIHGHPIKILVRLPRDIHLCKDVGFDAVYWAQNGLVDIVSPCGRFRTTDTGMPIAEWVQALSPYGVEVYAGLEMNLPSRQLCQWQISLEVAKAHTVQYAAQGSTRTYVYNLYHPYLIRSNGYFRSADDIKRVWASIGDAAACAHGTRRHVLTYDDTWDWNDRQSLWRPLPATVHSGTSLDIQTGPIDPNAELTLYMAITGGDPSKLRVTFNGRLCTYLGQSDQAWVLQCDDFSADQIAAFRVPLTVTRPVTQTVYLSDVAEATVHTLELLINTPE